MRKYYTRACNFHYGSKAKILVRNKLGLPLCGKTNIAFDKIEIIERNKSIISSKTIRLKEIKNLKNECQKAVIRDLKKISQKRKNFLKGVNFSAPTIMGILNVTPDSFSDGGKFNKLKKAEKHIRDMVMAGAKIIDIGGESTRPGSKTISTKLEWKRVKDVLIRESPK